MAEIVNKPENPFEAQKYFKKHALNHISKQELYEYSSAITNIQELDSDVEKYATAGRGYWIKRLAGDKTLEHDLRTNAGPDSFFCFGAKVQKQNAEGGTDETIIPFSVIEIAAPYMGPMDHTQMEDIYNRLRLYTARGIYPPVFIQPEEDAIYSSMEKWDQPHMHGGDIGVIVGAIKDEHVVWGIVMWDPTFITEENPMEILYGSQSGYLQMTGMIPTPEPWKDSPAQGKWWDFGIPTYTYTSVAAIAAFMQRSERLCELIDSMILTDQIVLTSYQNLLRTMRDEASRMEALKTAKQVMDAVQSEQKQEDHMTLRPMETPDSEVTYEDAFAARMLRCEEPVSDTYVGESVTDTIIANSFGDDASI